MDPIEPTPVPTADATTRNYYLAMHLSPLVGCIIPFGHIIGPLLLWQVKKAEVPGLEEHGKEVLNFQISMTIYPTFPRWLIKTI